MRGTPISPSDLAQAHFVIELPHPTALMSDTPRLVWLDAIRADLVADRERRQQLREWGQMTYEESRQRYLARQAEIDDRRKRRRLLESFWWP